MPSVTKKKEKGEATAAATTTTRNKTNNEIKQNKFYWKFNYVAHKLMKLGATTTTMRKKGKEERVICAYRWMCARWLDGKFLLYMQKFHESAKQICWNECLCKWLLHICVCVCENESRFMPSPIFTSMGLKVFFSHFWFWFGVKSLHTLTAFTISSFIKKRVCMWVFFCSVCSVFGVLSSHFIAIFPSLRKMNENETDAVLCLTVTKTCSLLETDEQNDAEAVKILLLKGNCYSSLSWLLILLDIVVWHLISWWDNYDYLPSRLIHPNCTGIKISSRLLRLPFDAMRIS